MTKTVRALVKRLHTLPISQGNCYVEYSIRVKKKQMELLLEGLEHADQKIVCAKAFISSGGVAVIRSSAVQRKLAAAAIHLLLLLCRSRLPGVSKVLLDEGMISFVASLAQRCISGKLHHNCVHFFVEMSIDSAHGVINAVLALLNTQCRCCKSTALKSLSAMSLDATSTRNLFAAGGGDWMSELLPALFRIVCDGRIASRKLQFEACQVIYVLCWASPVNVNADIMQFIRTLFLLECSAEGRAFLVSLDRWRIRERRGMGGGGGIEADSHMVAHAHACIANFLIQRLLGAADASTLLALRQMALADAMLLFSLTVEKGVSADNAAHNRATFAAEQALREAREAAESVTSTLRAWMRRDVELDAELSEMHGANLSAFVDRLRSEAVVPVAEGLERLQSQLAHSLAADSKGHPDLLSMYNEGPRSEDSGPVKSSGPIKLGYTMLAQLFKTDSHEGAAVSDELLEGALLQLNSQGNTSVAWSVHQQPGQQGRGRGASPIPQCNDWRDGPIPPCHEHHAREPRGWEQPTKSKAPKKVDGRYLEQPPWNTAPAGRAPRPPIEPSHSSAMRLSPRPAPLAIKAERFSPPKTFVGIDLMALERLTRSALFATQQEEDVAKQNL